MNAQEFFNTVVLMRANQKGFFALSKKRERTAEEDERRKSYLKNSIYFEQQVDSEIQRVQEIVKRKEVGNVRN